MGAPAVWARFSLEGDAFMCQVWDGKRKKFIEAAPEASHVQADYRFIQKGLREQAKRLKAAPPKVAPEQGLACSCGAAVQRTATRCGSCGRNFKEPLRVDAFPRSLEDALSSARKRLHALGLYFDSEAGSRTLAELHPQNAKQALGAPGVLRDAGIRLLTPEEFERCKAERTLKKVAKAEPPAVPTRSREKSVAAPPGIECREAWALEVHRVKTPRVRCPECGASIAPKAELRIPRLGKAIGARTVRIYECDACAREEPTADKLQVRVEAGAPRGTQAPEHFMDPPDVDEARMLVKKGFDEKRYRAFLQQNGLFEPPAAKLGGYAGLYAEPMQLQIGVRCKHPTELLHLSPYALGLQLVASGIAVEFCVKPGCKRPGVCDEVNTR
jgi:hypothetical protein